MDQLSELKDKLQRNIDNRNTAVELYHEADNALSEKEDKLQRKVASLLENEKMALASYREIIKGSMDRLNSNQQENNAQIAELMINLKDMSDLKALYETKREIMEQNHQELVKALENEENKLKRRVSKLKETTKELQEEYDQTSLRLETKKQADKFIAIAIIVFAAVVIGSWLGLGFVDILRAIGEWVKGLFPG